MEVLDELARRQWGLLTHGQLLNCVTRGELAWMLKRGRLYYVHHGVYRMAGAPKTWQQEVAAALMALPRGVASHLTAARLFELPFGSMNEVHVTIPLLSSHQRSDVEIHRSDVPDEQVTVVQRISCTTIERTILDIAGVLTRGQLAFVIDEAVALGKTTFVALDGVMQGTNTKGKKGVRNLRELLKKRLPLAEGAVQQIELKVLKAVQKAGLAQPRRNSASIRGMAPITSMRLGLTSVLEQKRTAIPCTPHLGNVITMIAAVAMNSKRLVGASSISRTTCLWTKWRQYYRPTSQQWVLNHVQHA